MNDCKTIKEITIQLESGADADRVIPYHVSGFSNDCIKELLLLYMKYGKNERRKQECLEKYKEMDI